MSPVDQVIVVNLTADSPRSLNFSATFETPQKATVSTEGPNTLVLRGVNGDAFGIKGGLKFEARVLVLARGGETGAEKERIVVSNADSAVASDRGRDELSQLQRHKRRSAGDYERSTETSRREIVCRLCAQRTCANISDYFIASNWTSEEPTPQICRRTNDRHSFYRVWIRISRRSISSTAVIS